MAAVTSMILVKRFTYRGDPTEEFSNRYYFRAAPPGDTASWTVLMNDLVAAEKPIMPPSVSFVHAYGYNDDAENAHAVFDHDLTVPGPPPVGTYTTANALCAGDQAAMVFWKTDRKNARGKWIYLRKYFHGCSVTVGDPDHLENLHITAYQTFATLLSPNGGAFHGGIRSRTHADGITNANVDPYVTTRTLKRRGTGANVWLTDQDETDLDAGKFCTPYQELETTAKSFFYIARALKVLRSSLPLIRDALP